MDDEIRPLLPTDVPCALYSVLFSLEVLGSFNIPTLLNIPATLGSRNDMMRLFRHGI